MSTTPLLWVYKHGSFWSTKIANRNCLHQSCRLLAIHYGDAQRLNCDTKDFDRWSGFVDLCHYACEHPQALKSTSARASQAMKSASASQSQACTEPMNDRKNGFFVQESSDSRIRDPD